MKTEFEKYLETFFNENTAVDRACRYALLGGGKRVRPMLLLNYLKDCGVDLEYGFACAAGIEMIHTYSLIHDDLPAMDNDDLRRGQPTVHRKFNEAVAILAGDALLTKAFEVIGDYDGETVKQLTELFATSAGHKGMIKGQILDLEYEGRDSVTFDELKIMDNCKTGYLLRLPLLCGAVLANRQQANLSEIGFSLGLAFQIQDDILDYTATEEELGKSTSDAQNGKSTYYTLLGRNEALALCDELYGGILAELGDEFTNLKGFIEQIRYRGN